MKTSLKFVMNDLLGYMNKVSERQVVAMTFNAKFMNLDV